jgi:hypothetical protein
MQLSDWLSESIFFRRSTHFPDVFHACVAKCSVYMSPIDLFQLSLAVAFLVRGCRIVRERLLTSLFISIILERRRGEYIWVEMTVRLAAAWSVVTEL